MRKELTLAEARYVLDRMDKLGADADAAGATAGRATPGGGGHRFADLKALDIVGIYPNYRSALAAWRGKAQGSVDNARMRYYVVHLHRLLDPDVEEERQGHETKAGRGTHD